MGKTSLAQAVVHHTEIAARYDQLRFFVACDSAVTKAELVVLIAAHLGLKPGKDLTRIVVNHFSNSSPTLLVFDNLETLWEPTESRGDVEEFLSLLTDIKHLALMVGTAGSVSAQLTLLQITMRGAERPAKVSWSRPFLQPLQPLEHDAALQTFLEITDCEVGQEEVDKVLLLTDNMPLAINLLAHLVDAEGCSTVLARWEQEKTAVISDGYDKRSNLDLSISLSMSSPRIKAVTGAEELLSLLSILPDGLSDKELVQSGLPIANILRCKAALIGTALAYNDKQKRIKALVPIREYIRKMQPPGDHLVRPLFKHFQKLLEFYTEFRDSRSNSGIVAQISLNFANMQNVILNGLHPGHLDLTNSMYCTLYLVNFSVDTGWGIISATAQIPELLPHACNPRLEVYFIITFLSLWKYYPISDPKSLISKALRYFNSFDDVDLKCKLTHY
jgi:hypothetical protein